MSQNPTMSGFAFLWEAEHVLISFMCDVSVQVYLMWDLLHGDLCLDVRLWIASSRLVHVPPIFGGNSIE